MPSFTSVFLDIMAGLAAVVMLITSIMTVRYRRAAFRSEDRFRRLVDGVPEYAIFMLDPSGRIVSWNASGLRITGYSEKEILGQHVSTFYPAEELAAGRPEEELRIAAAQGRLEHTGWHLRKDGTRFWADIATAAIRGGSGELRGFSKVVRDSTERKRVQDELAEAKAELDRRVQERTTELEESNRLLRLENARRAEVETSLRKSEALARGMFETAVDAIITIDEFGQIGSFNPAAERLFGYSAAEVIGRNVNMLMPQPMRREHDVHLARYLRTGRRHIIGIGREVIGRRKDGMTFHMDLAVGEHLAGDQHIFTAFVRDLTERKLLEAEVLQISEREQQRIGQDLHDGLGQHLTGVAFLAKVLAGRLAGLQLPEAASAKKINELVNQAVSQTRALSRGLQPLADAGGLEVAIEHLCESVHQVFGIDCALDAMPTPSLTDLQTATHLYRIVQEAVNNAIRHGKASAIAITLEEAEGQIELTVRDNGEGFGEVLGTGIGLRTMHYRARTIGATLNIRQDPAGGVAVTCCLETSSSQAESP